MLANVSQADNNVSNIITPNISNKYTSHSTSTNPLTYGSITYSSQLQEPKSSIQSKIANYETDSSKNTANFAQITSSSTAGTQQTQSILQSELSQDLSSLFNSSDAKRVLQNVQNVNPSWQSLTNTSVADYLNHLPSTIPLSLHHFLKYSTENIKKEATNPITTIDMQSQHTGTSLNLNNLTSSLLPTSSTTAIANILNQQNQQQSQNQNHQQQQNQHQQNAINQQQNQPTQIIQTATVTIPTPIVTVKKKKKKKPPKEKKPRPKAGEIRIKTALDGSTLFVCPECAVAYPEK